MAPSFLLEDSPWSERTFALSMRGMDAMRIRKDFLP